MKKFLTIILLGSCLTGFAQESTRRFRFGLKAAPTLGWIKPDYRSLPDGYTVEGGGLRLGFIWGPSAEWMLNETFIISTGADISYTSGKIKGKVNTKVNNLPLAYDWQQVYKLRFIDIPLMLKFRTKEIGYFRYFGVFGLGAGFRTSAKTEFSTIVGSSETIDRSDNSKKYVNLFRGSMLVGGGAEYNLAGNTSLVASIVFNNGLTNLIKDQGASTLDPSVNLKESGVNNYFMLNLGVLF
ncbi:MAG: PorT family protein [Bacteroidia bacterium]|nr:PorT family protein [Bacteroidia bacterium]